MKTAPKERRRTLVLRLPGQSPYPGMYQPAGVEAGSKHPCKGREDAEGAASRGLALGAGCESSGDGSLMFVLLLRVCVAGTRERKFQAIHKPIAKSVVKGKRCFIMHPENCYSLIFCSSKLQKVEVLKVQQDLGHVPDLSASRIVFMHKTRSTSILLIIDTLFNESEGKKS